MEELKNLDNKGSKSINEEEESKAEESDEPE
jgi:hypothetical protein